MEQTLLGKLAKARELLVEAKDEAMELDDVETALWIANLFSTLHDATRSHKSFLAVQEAEKAQG